MKECPDTGCYCDFVTFKPCPDCIINQKTLVTKEEELIIFNYIRLLLSNKKIPNQLGFKINDIYEKYPDINLSSI